MRMLKTECSLNAFLPFDQASPLFYRSSAIGSTTHRQQAATMKGLLVERPGGEIKIVDDLQKPSPDQEQLLVKPIYVAMNPVYRIPSPSGATPNIFAETRS